MNALNGLDLDVLTSKIKHCLSSSYDSEEGTLTYFDFVLDYFSMLEYRLKELGGQSSFLREVLIYLDPVVSNLFRITGNLSYSFIEEDEFKKKIPILKDKFNEYLKRPRSLFFGPRRIDKYELLQIITPIYYEIIQLKDAFKKGSGTNMSDQERYFEFYNFYTPDRANKSIVISLINEAIELLKTDNTLDLKAKEKLVQRLQNIINELSNKTTNWKEVFGKIKETIIVLGAIGSLSSGMMAISSATQKLEEAEKVMHQTSINTNYFIEENVTQLFIPGSFDMDHIRALPVAKDQKESDLTEVSDK